MMVSSGAKYYLPHIPVQVIHNYHNYTEISDGMVHDLHHICKFWIGGLTCSSKGCSILLSSTLPTIYNIWQPKQFSTILVSATPGSLSLPWFVLLLNQLFCVEVVNIGRQLWFVITENRRSTCWEVRIRRKNGCMVCKKYQFAEEMRELLKE